MKFLLALSMFASLALATEIDQINLPKSFMVEGSRAVFADFSEAIYHIRYDLQTKQASVKAEIKLETFEEGQPIFDSVVSPISVELDGENLSSRSVTTPNNETTLRIVQKNVTPGLHRLTVEVPLTSLVEFSAEGVRSAFWTSDLEERKFLERYLPANFEFDQVKMTFIIQFFGSKNRQTIYTNGVVQEEKNNKFKISFPEYYTASSIYFHTVPQGSTAEMRFSLKSIDGREIPAVVYLSRGGSDTSLERLKSKTTEVFHELESDYGPFPHPSVTVLQAGLGGMEYCGATMTEFAALGHELFHSYFARGVMPSNGNAGWVDEALASWRDGGYQTIADMAGSSGMSSHPYYTRTTDRAAYTFGKKFMSYLNGKLKDKGGLKPFMRYMVDKKVFTPLLIGDFIKEMSNFYGISIEEDFKKYTFSSKNNFDNSEKTLSHIHRKMTIEEMANYL